MAEWKQEFLNRASITGRVSFAPLLKNAGELWHRCESLYGAGSGYRLNVAGAFNQYFEENSAAMSTTKKIESSLSELWSELVIAPLRHAVKFEEVDG